MTPLQNIEVLLLEVFIELDKLKATEPAKAKKVNKEKATAADMVKQHFEKRKNK